MSDFSGYSSACALLFDLDGTIIDSRVGIVSTLHAVIAALGHTPDPQIDLTWVVGPPLAELMEEVIGAYGDRRVAEAIALYRHFYAERGRFLTPVFPEMDRLLRTLKDSAIRIFTATSKPASLARQILEQHGLDSCFEAICGAGDDDSGGEKPEMIARIACKYGLTPRRTLMIGDRRFDISGAHANQIRGLGVLWGYGGAAELTAAGADMLVETPGALGDAIIGQFEALSRHPA